MILGYAGYYLCRSNLSVTMLAIAEDLKAHGAVTSVAAAREQLGWVVTVGTVGYAAGKFAAGTLVDLIGGRRNYLLGMGGAIACTLFFAMAGSIPVFTLVWFSNRLIQSLGWPGMIKITSRWFPYSYYGTVMGLISLSFLFGDALARAFMGLLIDAGLGWRSVFLVTAGVLGFLWIINYFLIHESPGDLGLVEPKTNPDNLFGELGQDPVPEAAGPLWATLARSPAFWMVCFISLGVTLLRETFNNWTPTYLVEGVGLGKAKAAAMSSLFPFFGGVSVIAAGMLGDRFGRGGRAAIIFIGMLLCAVTLGLLGSTDFAARSGEALVLVSIVAFLLIGPYSYLAGAISLDFGGKRGGATACGIIDGVGDLFGGVVAGKVIADLSVRLGWQGVFKVLAVVACLTSLAAAFFLANQLRPTRSVDVPRLLDGESGELDARQQGTS
jgi:OPA family glycerol-3-phosphate transporter-like MFS transporter